MRFCGLVCMILLAGCSSHDPELISVVPDYFPLKTGSWFIYTVDSVVTNQNIAATYSYELRVQAIDSFKTDEGDYTWILQRSKRSDAASPWASMPTWSARLSNNQLIISEGNISYVAMESPLLNGTSWDGNGFNTLGGGERCPGTVISNCDLYTISDTGKPYELPDMTITNSVTVVESDDPDSIVGPDLRSRVYGKGVGLLYREFIQASYCTFGCSASQFITQGVSYRQTLKDYGGL
jgi:hypothetical protein